LACYSSRTSPVLPPTVGWYICGLGSMGVLLLVMRGALAGKILLRRELVFVGELSYGIYILHFPILLGLSSQLSRFRSTSVLLLVAGGTIATIALAYVCYRFLEKPLIELGRKLSARITQRGKHVPVTPTVNPVETTPLA